MQAWDQKKRIMRRYNQSARVYDIQYLDEQETKIRTIMKNLRLPRGIRILDVGCGTGLLFRNIVDKADFFVGIDISRGLIHEATKKARQNRNVALVLADADNMPLLDESFDTILAVTLMQNMPTPTATLTEFKRVAKQTASIVVTGLKKHFTQEGFLKMLNGADLTVDVLKLDDMEREYVSICRKPGAKSKSAMQAR
jgi:ubiquinone/menaquinone biosynthesis C-methylase UbiE